MINFLIYFMKILGCVLSGILMTASFPNFDMAWLSWIALIPLLIAINNRTMKFGFFCGWLMGFVHNLTLLYWLPLALFHFGDIPILTSIGVLLLLCVYLSIYPAVFAILARGICVSPSRIFLLPIFWVGLEYVKSLSRFGFPWELLGYSQYDSLYLIQIADVFGVYSVSALVVLANILGFVLILFVTRSEWSGEKINVKTVLELLAMVVIIFGVSFGYGALQIENWNKKIQSSKRINVTLVQGCINQKQKWDAGKKIFTAKKYSKLSLKAKNSNPDIVIWPETSLPFFYGHDELLTSTIKQAIQELKTHFLIGMVSFEEIEGKIKYYNSACLINPDGNLVGKYDKIHLVPFGEYVPFKKLLFFLEKIVEGKSDYSPGEANLIKFDNHCIGVQICYEMILPNLSRRLVKTGATVLVNMTNDAWFGLTSAPWQHFSMAVFRAIENRRSVARVANTGISGFIDPVGKIMYSSQLFTSYVKTMPVPEIEEKSFYTRFGWLFPIACLFFTITSVILSFKRDRAHSIVG